MTQRIEKPRVISGAHIGIVRLHVLISAAKLEAKGLKRNGPSATSVLKRALGIKGNRDKVIAAAEECLANVANW